MLEIRLIDSCEGCRQFSPPLLSDVFLGANRCEALVRPGGNDISSRLMEEG